VDLRKEKFKECVVCIRFRWSFQARDDFSTGGCWWVNEWKRVGSAFVCVCVREKEECVCVCVCVCVIAKMFLKVEPLHNLRELLLLWNGVTLKYIHIYICTYPYWMFTHTHSLSHSLSLTHTHTSHIHTHTLHTYTHTHTHTLHTCVCKENDQFEYTICFLILC